MLLVRTSRRKYPVNAREESTAEISFIDISSTKEGFGNAA